MDLTNKPRFKRRFTSLIKQDIYIPKKESNLSSFKQSKKKNFVDASEISSPSSDDKINDRHKPSGEDSKSTKKEASTALIPVKKTSNRDQKKNSIEEKYRDMKM